jgi:hypothetical protein
MTPFSLLRMQTELAEVSADYMFRERPLGVGLRLRVTTPKLTLGARGTSSPARSTSF